MRPLIAPFLTIVVVACTALTGCEPAEPVTMSAGAAETVITPTKDADAIHDDLFVRALIVSDGHDRIAILTADLIVVGRAAAKDIRAKIHEATGIAEANIIINASHTHNTRPRSGGGDTWEGLPWHEWMVTQFVTVATDADQARRPATLRVSRIPVQVGFNRRLPAGNGDIWMMPNATGPHAAWSDTLGAYGLDDNKRIAFLFTYAAHPVVIHESSDLISADVPGLTIRNMKDIVTAGGQRPLDGVFMFGQGCGADANMYPLRGGIAACERIGYDFATTIAISNDPVALAPGNVRAEVRTLSVPLRPPPSVEEVKQMMAANEGDKRLEKLLAKAEEGDTGRVIDYPLRAVAVGGDLCILSLPYETFVEYQLYADTVSPFKHTIVLGFSEGGFGYVATRADYERNASTDYEAGLTGNSLDRNSLPLDASAETIIKDGIRKLLTDLKHQ